MSTTTEKVITLNDDFTDALTDVPALITDAAPFAILIQEGKRSRFRKVLQRLRRKLRRRTKGDDNRPGNPDAYRQVQKTGTDAMAGLAVVWDARLAPLIAGPFFQVLAHPEGAAMLPRGILWVVVRHPVWGPTILATAHRPPGRYRRRWADFDQALEEWVDGLKPWKVLLGMDVNTTRWLALARRLGLAVAGKGIDVVMGRGVQLGNARRLKQRHSDHRPVAVDASA